MGNKIRNDKFDPMNWHQNFGEGVLIFFSEDESNNNKKNSVMSTPLYRRG